jgi:L-asparaginase II
VTSFDHGGGFVPIAVTRRSGLDESVHFGALVALGPSGDVAFSCGDADVTVYGRSANKPLQATAMLEAGLQLAPDLLAVSCASHDGSPVHAAAVRRILAGAGLDESALRNTPDLPLDPEAAADVIRSGGTRLPIHMNCSGKHAAMVATCVVNGWDVESYLDADHPLQRRITDAIDAMTAGPPAGSSPARSTGGVVHVGVDGCGAPVQAMPLVGLARAFRAIALERAAVWRAMTTHPGMVAGPDRDVTLLMHSVPELMVKDGAEGMFAAALPDGRAVALKVADGASRARPAVMVAALGALGVDVVGAAERLVQVVRGHGRRVGEVRAVGIAP